MSRAVSVRLPIRLYERLQAQAVAEDESFTTILIAALQGDTPPTLDFDPEDFERRLNRLEQLANLD